MDPRKRQTATATPAEPGGLFDFASGSWDHLNCFPSLSLDVNPGAFQQGPMMRPPYSSAGPSNAVTQFLPSQT